MFLSSVSRDAYFRTQGYRPDDSFLIIGAGAMLAVGFSEAADSGFSQPTAYAVIIAGAVFFVCAVIHFLTTKRNAIIPAVSCLQLVSFWPGYSQYGRNRH